MFEHVTAQQVNNKKERKKRRKTERKKEIDMVLVLVLCYKKRGMAAICGTRL